MPISVGHGAGAVHVAGLYAPLLPPKNPQPQYFGDEAEFWEDNADTWFLVESYQQQDQPPLPPEDIFGWDNDDVGDDWEIWATADSAPVGPNAAAAPQSQPSEDTWDWWSEGDDDELIILDDAIFENYVAFEDPWDWWSEDIEDTDLTDDGSNVQNNNAQVISAACPDDAWTHEDDQTEDLVGTEDSQPIGQNQPAPPPEDPWTWDDDNTDEPFAEDSSPVGPNFVAPILANCPEDAWFDEEDQTDELVGVDDSSPVGQNQPDQPVADGWDHEDPEGEELVGTDDSAPVGANVIIAQPNCPEDPWFDEEDQTDELVGVEDSAPVGQNQPDQPVADGWDHEDPEGEELVGVDDSSTVAPNIVLIPANGPEDAFYWDEEVDADDWWDLALDDGYNVQNNNFIPPVIGPPPVLPTSGLLPGVNVGAPPWKKPKTALELEGKEPWPWQATGADIIPSPYLTSRIEPKRASAPSLTQQMPLIVIPVADQQFSARQIEALIAVLGLSADDDWV